MNPLEQPLRSESRRQFLLKSGNGLGAAALSTMLNPKLLAGSEATAANGGLPGFPTFAPTIEITLLPLKSGQSQTCRGVMSYTRWVVPVGTVVSIMFVLKDSEAGLALFVYKLIANVSVLLGLLSQPPELVIATTISTL